MQVLNQACVTLTHMRKSLAISLVLMSITLICPAIFSSMLSSAYGDKSYVVQDGDYLAAIGLKFNVPWQKIAELNQIRDPNAIFPGELLKIPEYHCFAQLPNDTNMEQYTVQANDDIVSIAEQLGLNWQNLAKVNCIESPYLLYSDQIILFPHYGGIAISTDKSTYNKGEPVVFTVNNTGVETLLLPYVNITLSVYDNTTGQILNYPLIYLIQPHQPGDSATFWWQQEDTKSGQVIPGNYSAIVRGPPNYGGVFAQTFFEIQK